MREKERKGGKVERKSQEEEISLISKVVGFSFVSVRNRPSTYLVSESLATLLVLQLLSQRMLAASSTLLSPSSSSFAFLSHFETISYPRSLILSITYTYAHTSLFARRCHICYNVRLCTYNTSCVYAQKRR